MANLKEGSCFNCFNCFQTSKESFFSYFAMTNECQIDYLNVSDLDQLKLNFLDLNDTLKILYHRIKLGHVDDLDYFTFPYYKKQEFQSKKVQKQMDDL